MNERLLEIAHSAIAQCRVEGLDQDDTFHTAMTACVRYGSQQHVIGDELTNEMRAAIEAVVKQAMNSEPSLVRCPYCKQMSSPVHVELCPLRS